MFGIPTSELMRCGHIYEGRMGVGFVKILDRGRLLELTLPENKDVKISGRKDKSRKSGHTEI